MNIQKGQFSSFFTIILGLFLSFSVFADYITVEDGSLFVKSIGLGKKIVILHGGPGLTHDYVRKAYLPLVESNELIFFDQRGNGRSKIPVTAENITIDKMVNDIEAIRKHYDIDKLTLLGHSWGGQLAVRYALKHPDKIKSLILVGSAPVNSAYMGTFLNEVTQRFESNQKALEHIQSTTAFKEYEPQTHNQYFQLMFSSYCKIPEDAYKLNIGFTNHEQAENVDKLRTFIGGEIFTPTTPYDYTAKLKNIPGKHLVIHGRYDPIPLKSAEEMSQALHNCEFAQIESGHFPAVEDPEHFFATIKPFLAQS